VRPYDFGELGAGLRHGYQDDDDARDSREADEHVGAWCDLEAAEPGTGEQPEDDQQQHRRHDVYHL
jgi:hypothetical protein